MLFLILLTENVNVELTFSGQIWSGPLKSFLPVLQRTVKVKLHYMRTKCAISDAFVRDSVFAYCASVAQYVYSLSAEHCF